MTIGTCSTVKLHLLQQLRLFFFFFKERLSKGKLLPPGGFCYIWVKEEKESKNMNYLQKQASPLSQCLGKDLEI